MTSFASVPRWASPKIQKSTKWTNLQHDFFLFLNDMPPKRQARQEAGDGDPQPSTSRASREADEVEEVDGEVFNTQASTQSKKLMASLSEDVKQRKVNDLVQYLLIMDQKKYPIKRTDINKMVLKEHSRAFLSFMEEATVVLREVFGLVLVEVDSAKSYILINDFEQDVEHPLEWSPKDNMRMALVMIILSVIFMKGNVLTDVELAEFLKKLGVDMDTPHEAFGDVKKQISEFIKQGYLTCTKQMNVEPPKHEYRWGVRAKHELPKRYALDFVAQIYGTDTPERWILQYQDMLESEQQDSNGTS